MADYDAIVVGAGHNGLTAASILAKEGLKVLVLEKQGGVGGMAATKELFKGFKHNVGAWAFMVYSKEVMELLELKKYGLEFVTPPNTGFGFGAPGEKPFIHHTDASKMMEHLRRDHGEDAVQGMARLREFCRPFAEAWKTARFNPAISIGDIIDGAPTIEAKDKLRKTFFGSAMDVVRECFEHPEKHQQIAGSMLGGMAVDGTALGPYDQGTAFSLVYHLAAAGVGEVFRIPKGGMGTLSEALRKSLEEKGDEVRLNAAVSRILVENGKAVGVELAKGEKLRAKVVLSNLDAKATFLRLVGEGNLPSDFVRMVNGIKIGVPYIQIHLTLKELPKFTGDMAFVNKDNLRWWVFYCRGAEHLQQLFDVLKAGKVPEEPTWGYCIPSVWDDSVAPAGYHVATMFSYGFPILPLGPEHNRLKEQMADKLIDGVTKYAPNFRDAVMNRVVMTSRNFEAMYGTTNGCYAHGLLLAEQMFSFRPVVGWAEYRTPVENLYLCGSACHPGPGVTSIPGYNSAREVLKKWKKK